MKFKYDTIHLWIDKAYLSEKYDEEVSIKLTNRECSVNEKNEMKYSGYVRNMRITIKSTAVYIRGSIGKYANGDSTENALVTLCEYLQIPLEHAKVVRLHVALDLILDYPVKLYFKSLGHCKKYERFPFSKSVYYTNATSVLAFYNKIAEMRTKKTVIPNHWVDKNVLRYEVRFEKEITKQLGIPIITADILHTAEFYTEIERICKERFRAIDIEYEYPEDLLNLSIDTPRKFELALAHITMRGWGRNKTLSLIESVKERGELKFREYASVIKQSVRKYFDFIEQCTSVEDPIIKEFRLKIDSASF